MLERNSEEARMAFEAVLDGPLTFPSVDTPDGRHFPIEGMASVGRVLTAKTMSEPAAGRTDSGFTNLASPAGFVPLVNLASARNPDTDRAAVPWLVAVALVA